MPVVGSSATGRGSSVVSIPVRTLLVAAFAAMALLPGSSRAEDALHGVASIVHGCVVCGGRGVPAARISFPSELRHATSTDARGEYWLIFLTRGVHTIRVDAPGYGSREIVIVAPTDSVPSIAVWRELRLRELPLERMTGDVATFPHTYVGPPIDWSHIRGDADPIRNGGWLIVPLTEKPGPDSR